MSRQSIVLLLLAATLSSSVHAQSVAQWTTQDVIDSRIDVHAQYSLMRMLKGDAVERLDASAMLTAIKSGELAGIYIVDQRAPAMRAQEIGKSWWTILPAGVEAICITQPEGKPPLVAFSKRAQKDQHILDSALRNAWASCGIEPGNPRPYATTSPPKQPRETRPCLEAGNGGAKLEVGVVDAITLEPYPGAEVSVILMSGEDLLHLSGSTDETGGAYFTLPQPGFYTVVATVEETFGAQQVVHAEGNCGDTVVLWVRPKLDTEEPCNWDVYHNLLGECQEGANSAYLDCAEQAERQEARSMEDPEYLTAQCLAQLRRDKANCDDLARRGADCD